MSRQVTNQKASLRNLHAEWGQPKRVFANPVQYHVNLCGLFPKWVHCPKCPQRVHCLTLWACRPMHTEFRRAVRHICKIANHKKVYPLQERDRYLQDFAPEIQKASLRQTKVMDASDFYFVLSLLV